MTQDELRQAGELYDPSTLHTKDWIEAKKSLEEFNRCGIEEIEKAKMILQGVFQSLGQHSMIIPPLYYSQGRNIHIGEHFFANADLMILDDGDVTIGDFVFIGPRVSIFTAKHPIDKDLRNTGLQSVSEVRIGNNVWIGGNVVINPGITIGDGSVIGSGSVVTKDIEPGVVAAGNPCRVIRKIEE